MKIGIVTTWFERGAAYVSRQYREALASSNQVFIYARGGEQFARGNPVWDGPEVTWDGAYPGPGTTVNLAKFRNWIVENKIEVVFFNEQTWWQPVLLCAKLGVKTGAYIDYYTEKTIPLYYCYDFLICNTKRHLDAFSWHPQAYYVPWGTDVNLYRPTALRPDHQNQVVFFHSAGSAPRRKGCDLVIEAFNQLEGFAHLIIHTQTDLHKEFPHLSQAMDRLLLEGRLSIHEGTVSAPGLFHMGDVYVYPSRLDGVGLTVAEALACGLPVITSDNGPMNEFVDDTNGKLVAIEKFYARSDGYYWPQCLPHLQSLRNCMQYYVNNTGGLSALKDAARLSAEKKFDWKKNKEVLEVIFSDSKLLKNVSKNQALANADQADNLKTDLWAYIYKRYSIVGRILWTYKRMRGTTRVAVSA